MGEAKRRKAAAEREATSYNVSTGLSEPARRAGDPLVVWESVGKAASRAPSAVTGVPCNGCRECCYHAEVEVHPSEETVETLRRLDIVVKDDGNMALRKGSDGACGHLGSNGCTVYEHRPFACRTYDCRVFALFSVLDSYEGDHKQPAWVFEPRNVEGRGFLTACSMIGALTIGKRRRAGESFAAQDIVREAVTNERFGDIVRAVTTLAAAPRETQVKILGLDPKSVSKESMAAAWKRMMGDDSGV